MKCTDIALTSSVGGEEFDEALPRSLSCGSNLARIGALPLTMTHGTTFCNCYNIKDIMLY